jgi:hypothetical protein
MGKRAYRSFARRGSSPVLKLDKDPKRHVLYHTRIRKHENRGRGRRTIRGQISQLRFDQTEFDQKRAKVLRECEKRKRVLHAGWESMGGYERLAGYVHHVLVPSTHLARTGLDDGV